MANAFDGQSFSRVLVDAERLANRAIDHERRLTELVSTMERAVASRANGGKPGEWLDAVRQVCVAARDQRQAAGAIVARLASDVHRDRGHSRGGVLVVDDSEDNREIAALALEASGFHATTAANGLEGVIVAHYASPLVVLMDIAMPVLGGIEAARLLKASAVTSAIPPCWPTRPFRSMLQAG